MSQDDFKRAVRASRYDRAPGDAPNLGRVHRMPGTGLPKGERRKRRISEGGRSNRVREGRRRIMLIWTGMIVSLSIVVLGAFIGFWLLPQIRSRAPVPVVLPSETAGEPSVPRHPVPEESEALALVKSALAAREPEQLALRFRLGETPPEVAAALLEKMPEMDGTLKRLEWRGSMNANGLQLEGVVVHFLKDEQPRNRLALLTPDAEGRWQVDFASFARLVRPDWEKIVADQTDRALVRVYLARDNYFNGPFADEAEWECYGLASPDTAKILSAYCQRDSAQERALLSVLAAREKLQRVVLELEKVEGALPGQWKISRVMAEDWVLAEQPLDAEFQ